LRAALAPNFKSQALKRIEDSSQSVTVFGLLILALATRIDGECGSDA
jgi:hypothetical protein